MQRAALLGALLLVTACQTAPHLVPLSPDDPRPLEYLRGVAIGAEQRRALRGRARLAVDGDDGVRIRASQILVMERPAQLRVEVQGLFSQTAAVLASDGERYELFIPQEGRYESGPVDPELLYRVSGIAVAPEVVIDLVLGASIPHEDLIVSEAAATSDGQIQVSLTGPEGELRRRMAFDAEGRLRRLEVREGGRVAWEARFAGYELVDGRPFAHEIVLDVPKAATRAEITLRDVELNPPLPDGVFRLNLPQFQGGAGDGG